MVTTESVPISITVDREPVAVIKGKCVTNADESVGSAVDFDWIYAGGKVQILQVYGLAVGTVYKLRIVIL
jgi:hypothetical protein